MATDATRTQGAVGKEPRRNALAKCAVKRSGALRGTALPCMAEPLLHDLLDDPILQRLMLSDGIDRRHLLLVIDQVRSRLTDPS